MKHDVPTCKLHKHTGQAYVTLNGKRHYLGRHGTPEARANYARTIGEWEARGRQPRPAGQADLAVVEMTENFWAWAEKRYRRPDGELSSDGLHFRTVIDEMNRLYSRTPAAEFGPLKFKVIRAELLSTPDLRGRKKTDAAKNPEIVSAIAEPKPDPKPTRKRSRQYVNKLCARMRQIFRWAVAEELVPPSVHDALKAVAGLQAGHCEAPEAEQTTAVADSIVDATLKFLTPTVAAMVELQRLTGMRTGELCIMRTKDVNTSGDTWKYTPSTHKLSHRGRSRTVYIGAKGQAILQPWLRTELEAYIFSPAQADAERREQRHKERETPPNEGNNIGTNRKRSPRKKPGDRTPRRRTPARFSMRAGEHSRMIPRAGGGRTNCAMLFVLASAMNRG